MVCGANFICVLQHFSRQTRLKGLPGPRGRPDPRNDQFPEKLRKNLAPISAFFWPTRDLRRAPDGPRVCSRSRRFRTVSRPDWALRHKAPRAPYGSNKGLKMGPTKFKTNSKTLRIWGPRARGEAQGANHPRNERLVIVSLSACPPPAYLHVCIFSLDSFVGRFFVPFLRLFDLVYFVISSCPLCIYLSRSLNHCTSVSRSSRVSAPPAKSNTTYIR